MSSIASICIISLLSGCTEKSESVSSVKVDYDWLQQNLYRVESYRENEDGTYDAILVSLSDSTDISFDELKDIFSATEFSPFNGESLADGVNCQGMTTFVADWCQKHGCPYTIYYTKTHTFITVQYFDGSTYKFNFSAGDRSVEVVTDEQINNSEG